MKTTLSNLLAYTFVIGVAAILGAGCSYRENDSAQNVVGGACAGACYAIIALALGLIEVKTIKKGD